MNISDLYLLCLIVIGWFIGGKFAKHILYPHLIEKGTKEIETNPKWLMGTVREDYYGFNDIDIILVESTNMFCVLPRFRMSNDNKRFQLLVPNDMLTKDADEAKRLALMGKIKVKYGLEFKDKPIHWLSILCYMLDGGDIKQDATSWEKTHSEKQA